MIFRRKKRAPELNEETYGCWLRAGRPDLVWFLEQDADVQEHLAKIGDAYMQDVALATGYALQDPQLAEKGMEAEEDPQAEAELMLRSAFEHAQEQIRNGGPTLFGQEARK